VTLAEATAARVVQFSDTHISHRDGVPPPLHRLLDQLDDDPPDLLVVSGDIVLADPDDDADRDYAHAVLSAAPCPVVAIPGNHDVGFYGEDADRERRVAAFVARWGSDRFGVDVAGWRLVGANAYLLGDDEHDHWLHGEVTSGSPTAVFIHQPQSAEPADGWETPPWARRAFDAAIDGGDVRLIATGHRHRSIRRDRFVWAPSTTIVGETHPDGTDPALGAVGYTFRRSGELEVSFLRP
jgi:3',5'-cyclic AMP phosphodiesterase CpdA